MKPLATFTAPPIPPAYNASNFVPPLPLANFEDPTNPAQQKLDEISGEMERRNNPAYAAGRLLLDVYDWATRRNLDRHEIYGKFAQAYAAGDTKEARKHISRYIKRLDQLSSGDNREWFLKDQYDAGSYVLPPPPLPRGNWRVFQRNFQITFAQKQADESRASVFPSLIESYQFRIRSYFELGRYEEALQDTEKLIEIDPNNLSHVYNRGFFRFRLEDYSKARDDFSKVIAIADRNTESLR